jgi:hypothetical protein
VIITSKSYRQREGKEKDISTATILTYLCGSFLTASAPDMSSPESSHVNICSTPAPKREMASPASEGTPSFSPEEVDYETLLNALQGDVPTLSVPELYKELDHTNSNNFQSSSRFHSWLCLVPLSTQLWWFPAVCHRSLYEDCAFLGFVESVDGALCPLRLGCESRKEVFFSPYLHSRTHMRLHVLVATKILASRGRVSG